MLVQFHLALPCIVPATPSARGRLRLGNHVGDGSSQFRIAERRVAAARRHRTESVGGGLHKGRHPLGEALPPPCRLVTHARRTQHPRRMAGRTDGLENLPPSAGGGGGWHSNVLSLPDAFADGGDSNDAGELGPMGMIFR